MLGILIPITCCLISFAIAMTPAILKGSDPFKCCFTFMVLTIALIIGLGVTCRSTTYDVQVPIDQSLSLVTPSQVLSKGTHLNGDLKHAYLVTDKASKAIDKVETKGTGSTVTEITYSIRHTDNKWFGLTVDKDVEKRQTIATVHLNETNDKTLKQFFN